MYLLNHYGNEQFWNHRLVFYDFSLSLSLRLCFSQSRNFEVQVWRNCGNCSTSMIHTKRTFSSFFVHVNFNFFSISTQSASVLLFTFEHVNGKKKMNSSMPRQNKNRTKKSRTSNGAFSYMNHMLKHIKLAQQGEVKSKLLLWYVHVNECTKEKIYSNFSRNDQPGFSRIFSTIFAKVASNHIFCSISNIFYSNIHKYKIFEKKLDHRKKSTAKVDGVSLCVSTYM